MDGWAASRQLRNLVGQNLARDRIFIAYVQVDIGGFDDMRPDQRAFEKSMRVGGTGGSGEGMGIPV